MLAGRTDCGQLFFARPARKNISVSNSPYKKRKSFRKGNGKLKMLKVQVASKRRKGGGKDMGVPHIHLK